MKMRAVRSIVNAMPINSQGCQVRDLIDAKVQEAVQQVLFDPVCDHVVGPSFQTKEWYMEEAEGNKV